MLTSSPRVSLTLLLLVACAAPGQASRQDAAEKQVDALFAPYSSATPGVAVAVVRDGRVVFQKGYGSANLEHGVPVTPKTVFQLASVSKQFTAFAIYLLEKQNKLSLEDTVQKYIPELPDYGDPVRIRHLLGHTSGIRDHGALLTMAGWHSDDMVSTRQALWILARQKELNFTPGSAYLYGNGGYMLLAEIVQRVSGESFAGFAKRNIFAPLQMNDTRVCDDYEMTIRNRADSYYKHKGEYKRVYRNDAVVGPSNLHTTVEDMAKWALNFENPVVGDRELIRRFNAPSLLENGERAVYYSEPGDIGYHAKGQVVRVYRGLDVLSHGGHAAAFRPAFWRFPGQRFAFVLLSNDEHFAQLQNAESIAGIFLGDALQPRRSISVPAPAAAAKPAANPNANLNDFTGRFYSAELDTAYTARIAGGRLLLNHFRHGDIALQERGPDSFTASIQFPVSLQFRRDAAGKVFELTISNFGAKNVRFQKAP